MKTYLGPHPLCGRCNLHHSPTNQCGICFKCNRRGHLARNCRAPKVAPLNVTPLQTIYPQADHPRSQQGVCFACGSPDHYRNACPRWAEPQAHVAVPRNQLQIVVYDQNRGQQGHQVQPRSRAFEGNGNGSQNDPNVG
jgi:hypothetical protein